MTSRTFVENVPYILHVSIWLVWRHQWNGRTSQGLWYHTENGDANVDVSYVILFGYFRYHTFIYYLHPDDTWRITIFQWIANGDPVIPVDQLSRTRTNKSEYMTSKVH